MLIQCIIEKTFENIKLCRKHSRNTGNVCVYGGRTSSIVLENGGPLRQKGLRIKWT